MRFTDFARISLATIGVCVFVRLLRWAHFLFFGGIMRKVDKVGRIVVPKELRKKYGLTEGVSIEFLDIGDGITVKPSDPLCKICRNRIDADAKLPLCDKCISKVKNL